MSQALFRVEIGVHPRHDDAVGRRVASEIRDSLALPVDRVRVVKVFTLAGLSRLEAERLVADGVLHDPVLQQASLTPVASDAERDAFADSFVHGHFSDAEVVDISRRIRDRRFDADARDMANAYLRKAAACLDALPDRPERKVFRLALSFVRDRRA